MSSVATWEELWSGAKAADMVAIAESLGAHFKKAGRAIYTAPCPLGCAKHDGFVVEPEKGVFLCRPSKAGGSVIDMVAHLRCCSPVEAAEFITGHERPGGAVAVNEDAAAAKRAEFKAVADARASERAADDAARLKRDVEAVASILARALPFPGSPAEDYLAARGAGMPRSMTRDLRYVPDLVYYGFRDTMTERPEPIASTPAMIGIIRALNGDVVGLHLTYLDPRSPRKFVPPDPLRNAAKKFRKSVEKLNGAMIRLGMIGEAIVLGEGIETVGAYARRPEAPEGASYGVAMSLGNLSGGATGTLPHPLRDGATIMNRIPDLERPGVLLPEHVKEVFLLGDGDSDEKATVAALITAARRYKLEGRQVHVQMAPPGEDFASAGAS